MVRLLQGPSLTQLGEQLAEQLAAEGGAQPAPAPAPAPRPAPADDLLSKVEEMSDEEVEAMLNNMMSSQEGRAS
jgi:hypothetical protein